MSRMKEITAAERRKICDFYTSSSVAFAILGRNRAAQWHLVALASVPYGIVLVRVRVQVACGSGCGQALSGRKSLAYSSFGLNKSPLSAVKKIDVIRFE